VTRPALVDKFRAVTAERLGRLRNALPAASDPDQWAVVTRELHTIKGEAQLVGFAHVARVARHIEQLLGDGSQVGARLASTLAGLEEIDALRLLSMDDPEAASRADAYLAAHPPA
jgi:two-component system, chemotaxis family, sensor kinase CheA